MQRASFEFGSHVILTNRQTERSRGERSEERSQRKGEKGNEGGKNRGGQNLVGLHHELEGRVGFLSFGIEQVVQIGHILKPKEEEQGV
jgi:hypothetical protein